MAANNYNKLISISNEDLTKFNLGENSYEVNFIMDSGDVELGDLIFDLGSELSLYGQGIPEPLILIKSFPIKKTDVKVMGRNLDTLKIVKNGVSYMKFFAKNLIEEINRCDTEEIEVTIIGKAHVNEWNGTLSPQIKISEIEVRPYRNLSF